MNQHQMDFIVHLQNDKSTKVSPQTFFFFVFLLFCWKEYMQIYISQLQQTVPQMRAERKRAERSRRAYNHTFIHPVFLPRIPPQTLENKNRQTFLWTPRAQGSPLVLAFSDPLPPQPTNTLCASYCLLFCHHDNRVQQ